jgi:hypothetical protein
MFLAWKLELQKFAGGLTLEEIRSAVLLGLLGFVIYPVIPDRFVDPWQLINPRAAWVIVIVIAGFGFANYVLLKLYGTRGVYLSAFLGGLVNSTAAAAELARPLGLWQHHVVWSGGFRAAADHRSHVWEESSDFGDFFARRGHHGRRPVDRHGNRCGYSCAPSTGAS